MIQVPSLQGWVRSPVGFRYYPGTAAHPPLRIFYPESNALNDNNNNAYKPFQCFQDERGAAYYLNGYLSIAVASIQNNLWSQRLAMVLAQVLAIFFPGRWRRLPNVFTVASNSGAPPPAPPTAASKLPVIVFSHGLTGTGQENTVLLAAWASLGLCVVSVHHTDGSSLCVPLPDGTNLYYDRGPPFSQYDANFRPNQVAQRARELLQACDFVSKEMSGMWNDENCNSNNSPPSPRMAVAGYSYGAATAARVIAMEPDKFCAAIFLDGWFYIDVSESAGVEFPFPKEAFDDNFRLPKANFFCNSESFTRIPKLWKATNTLAAKSAECTMHVISGTGHQSFCDVIFWLPSFLTRRFLGRGKKDPALAYREIVDLTSDFLKQHLILDKAKPKAE